MAKDDKEIVSAVQARLADRVGADRYETWFAGGTRLTWGEGRLTVSAPSAYLQDWQRKLFRKDLIALCEELSGAVAEVVFEVDAALCSPQLRDDAAPSNKPQGKAANAAAKMRHDQRDSVAPATLLLSSASAAKASSASAKPAASAGRSVAMIGKAGARMRPHLTFDQYVVGPCNLMAVRSAELVLEQPGRMTPLTLYGGAGLGKTHLLEALLSAARERQRHALYLSAEQFTSLFIEACQGKGVPSFRQKYRGVDLLLLDDIHYFARTRGTLVELLHTIDTLQRAGKQLVFAADRAPAEMPELGSEIVGRLSAGLHCQLTPPDFATRQGIVRELCRRIQLELPEGIDTLVALHIAGTARELLGALNRLDATSRALGQLLSREQAEETLAELSRQACRPVQLRDIQHIVCEEFGLTPETLLSNRRGEDVQQPRALAMFLARKHTRAALGEISRYFGRRSHSTVISANRSVEIWMSERRTLRLARQTCDVEQAIRRIEARLKAV